MLSSDESLTDADMQLIVRAIRDGYLPDKLHITRAIMWQLRSDYRIEDAGLTAEGQECV